MPSHKDSKAANKPPEREKPKGDAKIPSSASTGKPGKTDKDFAAERAAEHGAPLPAVSHSNDPVNAPPGQYQNYVQKSEEPLSAENASKPSGTANKAGQPEKGSQK